MSRTRRSSRSRRSLEAGSRTLLAWSVVVCLLAGRVEAEKVSSGLDPSKALTQLGLDTWTTEHGLPSATVTAVLETRDGYVWLATYDGLARFDGTRFTVFTQADGLGNNGVRALCEDRDGSLWIGTNGGGVVRLSRGRLHRLTTADGLPSNFVWSLHSDVRDGSIWMGTNGGGLARYREGRIEKFDPKDSGRTVAAIAQESDGTIWLATQADGLRRLGPDGTFQTYTADDGLPKGLVASVGLGREGALWGATSAGLFLLRHGRVAPLPAGLEPLRGGLLSSVVEDAAGTLWVGTGGSGVARFAEGKVSFLGSRDGVGDAVYALHADRDGRLWVGTNGAGVSRLRDGSFTAYTVREGLSRDFSYTTFEDRSGTLWAGTAGGLDRFDGTAFVPASVPFGRTVAVRSIAEGPDGALWIGTYGAGVWRLLDGRWQGYTARDGLAHDTVRAVLVDRAGRVWAATNGGLSVLEGGGWRSYRVSEGLPSNSLIGLAEDRQGNLWVGSDGAGLTRLSDGAFRTFTSREGLASDVVLALAVDSGGTLWIATNGGLSRFSGGRFTTFSSAAGLPSDSVTQVVEDARGDLWVGTSRGVSRISRASLEAASTESSRPLETERFDHLDGMKSSQCTAPGQPGGSRGRDGRLWFATTRGVASIDPAQPRGSARPPSVVIEEVVIDGKATVFEDGVEAPPGTSRIEIRFAKLSPLAPRRTAVRFRLEGFDDAWVDAGDRRLAEYTRVGPGRYTFRIAARAGTSEWSESGTGLAVRVLPRFYQTRPFALAATAAVLGLLVTGYRLRVRALATRERELSRLVAERTRKLARSEQRFRQLAENIDALFFVRSADPPEFLYVSPAFERIWGRPGPIGWEAFLETIHTDDREAVRAASARPEEGHDFEYRIVRADGGIRWIRSRAFPVLDEAGRVVRVAGIAEDVTERKSVEQMREDLVGTLVHDLKSPLTSMLASMDLLEASLAGPELRAKADLVRIARRGGVKLRNLVDAILDVSRLEQGAMPLAPEPVGLSEAVDEAFDLQRVLAEPRKLKLVNEVAAEFPRVWADRELLSRILQNLVGNAIKFTAEGGEVRVGAAREGEGLLRITVGDDGPGLPAELRERAFERFVTGRHAASGSGLGLTFCRLAVEAQGGQIRVESAPGAGAQFAFTLPEAGASPS